MMEIRFKASEVTSQMLTKGLERTRSRARRSSGPKKRQVIYKKWVKMGKQLAGEGKRWGMKEAPNLGHNTNLNGKKAPNHRQRECCIFLTVGV